MNHMNNCIKELKLSVRSFENFDERFKDLLNIHEDTMAYKEAH